MLRDFFRNGAFLIQFRCHIIYLLGEKEGTIPNIHPVHIESSPKVDAFGFPAHRVDYNTFCILLRVLDRSCFSRLISSDINSVLSPTSSPFLVSRELTFCMALSNNEIALPTKQTTVV